MRRIRCGLPALFACMAMLPAAPAQQPGGSLTLALRAEPKTLNPVVAADSASREVIGRMMADLIHINRETHRTEPALAESWTVSRDGRTYTLRLRRGLRFSDGHPCDASDVVFTFNVYLDPKVRSPHRDLLVIGGKPIAVRPLGAHTVVFELSQPYAAAERIFDTIAILPRHLLEKPYREGRFAEAWSLSVKPHEIAGLGPFRLREYVPGQRVVLERNPWYWKRGAGGARLPYLDSLVFLVAGSEDAQVVRFQGGETDMIARLGARNYAALERRGGDFRLHDLGPGLEYNFLFFNLNNLAGKDLPRVAARQRWFRKAAFRQAVSAAIDRQAIVKLVYQGRATPLWGHVTPGNRRWVNPGIPRPPRDPARARQLLREAGFSWRGASLYDDAGAKVEFTILVSASNPERVQIATVIQEDLKQIGVAVNVASLEFRAVLDRLLKTHDYEACVLGLGGGDADPNAEMNVWLSTGGTHLWNLGGREAAPWEREIDALMNRQLVTLDYAARKRLYDRVQELVAQNLPIIPLVSPNVLAGAKNGIGNFRPVILDHNTLWNVEEIFIRR